MTKIAALFSGQIRQLPPLLFNKSLNLFFDKINVDFYLAYWDKPGKSLNHKKNQQNQINFDVENYLTQAFSGFQITSKKAFNYNAWESNLSDEFSKIHYDEIENSFMTKNSLPQLYLIEECFNLIDDINNYDYFVRLRFDNLFVHKFDISELKKGIFNLNFGNAFFEKRIYDIFFLASKEYSAILMKTYSRIPKIYNLELNNNLEKRDACGLLYKSIFRDIKKNELIIFNYRYTEVYRPEFNLNYYLSNIYYCYCYNGNFKNRSKTFKVILSNFKKSNIYYIIYFLLLRMVKEKINSFKSFVKNINLKIN